MATNLVQIDSEAEIKQRLEAERARLRKVAGLDQPTHFHRPVERAFTAEQRPHTTILFGGFTWKHEDLIRAVFQGCGYRCEKLPVPYVARFRPAKNSATTASATRRISRSAIWCAVSPVPGESSAMKNKGVLRGKESSPAVASTRVVWLRSRRGFDRVCSSPVRHSSGRRIRRDLVTVVRHHPS